MTSEKKSRVALEKKTNVVVLESEIVNAVESLENSEIVNDKDGGSL